MSVVQTSGLEEQVRRLKRRLWLERTLFILLLAPAGTLWLLPRLSAGPSAICVEGHPIAVLANRAAADRVLTAVKQEKAGAAAGSATFAREVTLTRAGRDAGAPVPEPEAARRLAAAVPIEAARAVILVDGKPMAALPTEREASAALDTVKAYYAAQAPNLVEEPRFKQQVTIVQRPAPSDLWCADVHAAAALLREGRGGPPEEHRIATGDTVGGIAERYRLTLAELTRLNPGLRPTRLRVGDTVRVRSPRAAPLTVIVRARVKRVPRHLPPPAPRRGPAEVTYENGVPVAATSVTGHPAFAAPDLSPAPKSGDE
jgi:hypothetical protein